MYTTSSNDPAQPFKRCFTRCSPKSSYTWKTGTEAGSSIPYRTAGSDFPASRYSAGLPGERRGAMLQLDVGR